MREERQGAGSRRLILVLLVVLLALVVLSSVLFLNADLVGVDGGSGTPPPVPTIAPATEAA